MTFLHALLLGILQGFTEFLPISSDGHLAVAGLFFRIPAGRDALGFDVILHAGSFLALLLCYARRWWKLVSSLWTGNMSDRRMLLQLVLATIPAVIAGLLLEDLVATTFRTITLAALGFLVTAAVLLIGEYVGAKRSTSSRLGFFHALLIGIAQAIAILPGVSRSGLTISAGRIAGLTRKDALDFSFLLATPVIGGAVALIALQTIEGSITLPPPDILLTGFLASFLTSLLAILFLLRFVRHHSLAWFSLYLVPLGIFLLIR